MARRFPYIEFPGAVVLVDIRSANSAIFYLDEYVIGCHFGNRTLFKSKILDAM
jgi:hypothetical protein